MVIKNDFFVYKSKCKACGEEFFFTEESLSSDIEKGLSKPTNCIQCRLEKRRSLNKLGVHYWNIPFETDFELRSLTETGLGRLQEEEYQAEEMPYTINEKLISKFESLEKPVDELIQNLNNPGGSRVSIFTAPTGVGKTVWVTSRILRSPIGQAGRIVITQPRKITMRTWQSKDLSDTTPGFIAKKVLGAPGLGAGQEVGLLYRGETTQHDHNTKLLFITDGILVNWLISGEINNYSVVIIDEAHEQSFNMELIFALLRYKLAIFPYLKIVIMSATIDTHKFQKYFEPYGKGEPKKVPVFEPTEKEERTLYKIYDRWPDSRGKYGQLFDDHRFIIPSHHSELPEAVSQLVVAICTQENFTKLNKIDGDILIFLPTIMLVKFTKEMLQNAPELVHSEVEILECHAQMLEDEHQAFQESEVRAEEAFTKGRDTFPRRIIIATNYAETSATFPNLCFVIDSGYISEPIWNARTCMREFRTTRHSRAGCHQRRGRLGRRQEGEFFRLYTKRQFENEFFETPLPEIAHSNLDIFLLKASASGIRNLGDFQWLGLDNDTCEEQILEKERAIKLLNKFDAICDKGCITQLGFQIQKLEVDTFELGLILLISDKLGCALETAALLALIENSSEIFEDTERGILGYRLWSKGCSDDFEYYFKILFYWNHSDHYSKSFEQNSVLNVEWLQRYGFRQDTYQRVKTRRGELLKSLCAQKFKALEKRKIDCNKLKKIRVLIAWAMMDYAHVCSDKDTCQNFFSPISENISYTKPIQISENSVCAFMNQVTAFVCMKRTIKQQEIFAESIIWIEQNWISELSNTKSSDIFYKIKKLAEDKQSLIEDSIHKMSEIPDLECPQDLLQVGEIRNFSLLQALLIKGNGERKKYLVSDLISQEIFIIKNFEEENKIIPSGSTFRAIIEEVNVENRIITVSQYKLYPKGTEIETGKTVSKLSIDGNTLEIELEPGVKGILRLDQIGESDKWSTMALNGKLPLKVKSASKKSIILEASVPQPSAGNSYNGYIVSSSTNDTRGETGIFVEIAPGIKGLIPALKLSSISQRSYKIGDEVKVTVCKEEEFLELELLE